MTSKKSTTQIGREAESLVCAHLQGLGYEILDRNYYLKYYGELDIIAKDGDTIAFVEVKYRKNDRFGAASDSVTYRKQQKIARVAEYYMNEKQYFDFGARFDVAEVYGNNGRNDINLMKGAFYAN